MKQAMEAFLAQFGTNGQTMPEVLKVKPDFCRHNSHRFNHSQRKILKH